MKNLIYYVAVALMFLFNAQLFSQTDYVLNGHAEVVAFVAGGTGVKEDIGKLTVYGLDVTQADFNSLADRIKSCGTVTFENFTNGTGWNGQSMDPNSVGDIAPFFSNVTCKGGIILRNMPYMGWASGLLIPHVYGDFVMDRCAMPQPGIDGWNIQFFFGSIEQVDGDFIISHFTNRFSHGDVGYKLKTVGGNFEISYPIAGGNGGNNASWTWEMGFQNLETVGGNFTIDGDISTSTLADPMQVWTLDCLSKIQSIGGNVKIVNLPKLGVGGQGNYPFGYCFVRYLIDAGMIDYAHHNVQLGTPAINLAELGGCADGVNPDNPPIDLPATGISDLKNSVNRINVSNNALNIESQVDLSKVEVFSMTGSSLLQFSNVPAGITSHNVSTLLKGVYMIKLTATNHKTAVYKVIK